MTFHREHVERELQADGMPCEAAKYAARRQFGNATQTLEESHDVVAFGFETALQDFRFAIRQSFRAYFCPSFLLQSFHV